MARDLPLGIPQYHADQKQETVLAEVTESIVETVTIEAHRSVR